MVSNTNTNTNIKDQILILMLILILILILIGFDRFILNNPSSLWMAQSLQRAFMNHNLGCDTNTITIINTNTNR